jgi:hypothetical protein
MTIQHLAHAPIIKSMDWQIRWVGVTALTWIVSVLALASWNAFNVPASEPALPTVIALLVPVVAFVAAMFLSKDLRAVAMNLDPVLLTEFQAWRILGGLFLAVYAFGHLPGLFAWPAGLGDVAIGVAAPFMAWRLRNDPGFLNSRRFLSFNLLGLADFIVAVATGVAARQQIPGFVEQVTTSAMSQLPLIVIPTIIVPAFIILHLIVLMQVFNRRQLPRR